MGLEMILLNDILEDIGIKFIEKIKNKIDDSYNPHLALRLDFAFTFIWCIFLLGFITLFLYLFYDQVVKDNVLVMIFELAYAFTGAYMLAYYFFNKEAGSKKYSKITFSEAIKEVYFILTKQIDPDNSLNIANFRRARYFCEIAKRSLENYDSSKIKETMDLELYRDQLQNDCENFAKFEEAKQKLESNNLKDHERGAYENIFGKYEYPKPTTEADRISELIKKMCTDFGLNVNRRIKNKDNKLK